MAQQFTRRSILKTSTLALTAGVLAGNAAVAMGEDIERGPIHLNLNENAWGPSPRVAPAVQLELPRLARYADAHASGQLAEQIAAYERVDVEQIVLGEILAELGIYLGSRGGAGGEFLYSTPGYLAMINAAARVGGVGVGVPLNDRYENDLTALAAKIHSKTRAIYLVNPHNPTGTVSDSKAFHHFLQEASQRAPVVVDEAYLEYTPDFAERSAVNLTREGANVLVFRTFDKIHGLAGLPIGYTVAPRELAKALHDEGLGDAEALGRLNIAAASAALADASHVARVRDSVAVERAQWTAVLDELKLPHTDSQTNFVFFDAGRPQPEVASALLAGGVEVGRIFAPYTNWVRISIGLPDENRRAQQLLRKIVRGAFHSAAEQIQGLSV